MATLINAMNRPTGTVSLETDSPVRLQWQIPDYFTVPQETSRIFISCTFLYLRTEWRLALVASGINSRTHPDWIGLKLLWDGSTASTSAYRISLDMGINRPDGTEFRSWSGLGDPSSRDWGPKQLVRRSELIAIDGVIAPDGLLRVFCTLNAEEIKAVDTKSEETSTEGTEIEEKAQNLKGVELLLQNFKDLMFSGEESNITVVVQGREFKSHRAVLAARSPVFAAMLRHNMKEKDSGVVLVEDCDPVTFELFLEHLYTGSIQKIPEDNVCGLYRIADKYDTEDLKAKCFELILLGLSIETFCDIVTLSIEHDNSLLLEKSITFFSQNMRQIIATAKWQEFLKKYTETGNSLLLEALDSKTKDTKK